MKVLVDQGFCGTEAGKFKDDESVKTIVKSKRKQFGGIQKIVAKYLFSYDSENCKLHLWEKFSDFPEAFVSFPVSIPGTRYHRCMKNHKESIDFLKNAVKERREMPGTQKGDCVDEAIGFLLAGFETVASALTFGVIMLAENPTVLEELAVDESQGKAIG